MRVAGLGEEVLDACPEPRRDQIDLEDGLPELEIPHLAAELLGLFEADGQDVLVVDRLEGIGNEAIHVVVEDADEVLPLTALVGRLAGEDLGGHASDEVEVAPIREAVGELLREVEAAEDLAERGRREGVDLLGPVRDREGELGRLALDLGDRDAELGARRDVVPARLGAPDQFVRDLCDPLLAEARAVVVVRVHHGHVSLLGSREQPLRPVRRSWDPLAEVARGARR